MNELTSNFLLDYDEFVEFERNGLEHHFDKIRELGAKLKKADMKGNDDLYQKIADEIVTIVKQANGTLNESKKSARKSIKESTDIFDTLENAWDKSTMNNNVFEKTVLKLKTDSFKDPFDKHSTIYMFADGSSINCESLDPFDCDWCTYVSEDLSFVHELRK